MSDFPITDRAGLIASFEANIASLAAERDALTDAERVQYIIECDGLAIDINGVRGTVGGMVAPLRDASRFTKLAEAQALAAKVVNGRGTRGRVITLGSAYNEAIDAIVNCISFFKKGE